MKKLLGLLALVAIVFTATPALAHNNELGLKRHQSSDKFMTIGTIVSTTSSGLTLKVETSAHLKNIANGQVNIVVSNNAEFKVGDRVAVSGTVNGVTLTAVKIHRLGTPANKAYGKVTAKSDSSISVQNTVTGAVLTFNIDGSSKITINGEAKTLADVNVGDAGKVKYTNSNGSLWARILSLFR